MTWKQCHIGGFQCMLDEARAMASRPTRNKPRRLCVCCFLAFRICHDVPPKHSKSEASKTIIPAINQSLPGLSIEKADPQLTRIPFAPESAVYYRSAHQPASRMALELDNRSVREWIHIEEPDNPLLEVCKASEWLEQDDPRQKMYQVKGCFLLRSKIESADGGFKDQWAAPLRLAGWTAKVSKQGMLETKEGDLGTLCAASLQEFLKEVDRDKNASLHRVVILPGWGHPLLLGDVFKLADPDAPCHNGLLDVVGLFYKMALANPRQASGKWWTFCKR
jgi:hypothetical protein